MLRDAQRRREGERSLGQPSLGQNESSSARGAAKVCERVCVQKCGFSSRWEELRGCSAAFYTAQSLALDRPPPAGICVVDASRGLVLRHRGDLEPDSKSATRTRENPCATPLRFWSSLAAASLGWQQCKRHFLDLLYQCYRCALTWRAGIADGELY